MKLLIVDDEVFAVKGILDSVDWTILKFEEVLTANSYSQAVNIMSQNTIEVLLCDIEMPMGSGLDLVEWSIPILNICPVCSNASIIKR